MKRLITVIAALALLLACVPAACAETVTVSLTDDGTVPAVLLHAAPAQVVEAGPLRLTVNEVRVGSYSNMSREYSPGFDARPGERVLTVAVNVTVESTGGVFFFDPRAVLLTVGSGEAVNCLAYSSKAFLTVQGPGAAEAQTGALFFVLRQTSPMALGGFALDFCSPWSGDEDLAEPLRLGFEIDG